MKRLWQNLPVAYKLFALTLLFLAIVEIIATAFVWQYESHILLQKERQNLTKELENHRQRLLSHLQRMEKEVRFLSRLEVMDDIVAKDIDQRILTLLEQKASDLGENIILLVVDNHDRVIIAKQAYRNLPIKAFASRYLIFRAPVYASFKPDKKLGSLMLLYPYENLRNLQPTSPSRSVWLQPAGNLPDFRTPPPKHNTLIVSTVLQHPLQGWQLHLSLPKEEALATLRDIEQVQLYTFMISTLLLAVIIFVLSRRLTLPLVELLKSSEKALEAKSTFLSTISHELRTPLGSILNLTQHLTLSPKADDKMRQMLHGIETSAQHLLAMINNILQLSRLEAKSIIAQKESVNLQELLEEIVEIITPLAEEKNLTFTIKTDLQNPLITSDTNLLKQVMINLLSNAVKFTPKGYISVTLREKNALYTFVVEDSGIGISKARQKDLFAPFYQAHTDIRNLKNSSGLGLALSQKVARLLRGKITIESEGEHMGTTATFTFRSF